MDDVVFIEKLFKNRLLPSELKADINALPTKAKKAAKLLHIMIEPAIKTESDNTVFGSLLLVMKDSGYENVQKLAEKIMSELGSSQSSNEIGKCG